MADNEPKKPSFLSSVMSGIAGSIKGALAGGAVGALMGAVAGAAIAAATGGLALPVIALGALVGAEVVGVTMGAVGALSGTVTGVVTSREATQPSYSDMGNSVRVSQSQGVSRGLEITKEQDGPADGKSATQWRDTLANQQASRAVSQSNAIK
jgi:hypothetical protein